VTLVTHTAELGGAEIALLRLVSALDRDQFVPNVIVMADGPLADRLRRAEVPCTVIDGGTAMRATRSDTSSPRAAPAAALGAWRAATVLARHLREHEPELVIANSLKAATLLSVAARRAKVPWAWHLHDRLAPDYLPRTTVTLMQAIAAHGPRVVVANSRATLETLSARGQKRAVVAYPGVPRAPFPPEAQHRSGIIGIVGRISPTKGQLHFIEAARMLHAERPGLRFRIIGAALFSDGGYEAEVHAAIRRLPDGVVEVTGWVDDPAAELGELEVLVHASPVPEPFGQVVVEAMAAGAAVVATRAGGVVEILDPTGAAVAVAEDVWATDRGMLVAPSAPHAIARAVAAILDDPEGTRQRVIAAADTVRSEFSIDGTARAVQAAWSGALGEGA
jgi:glycosyltransferase involved in cell wall biosynthesis